MGVVDGKSAVTPWVLFDSNQACLELQNEVQYVSELPLDLKNQPSKCTVVFWGSIIRLEISAQYHIFMILKLEKWMNSEG